jgi:hypothetical protein
LADERQLELCGLEVVKIWEIIVKSEFWCAMPNLRQKIRDVFSWQHDTYEFEEEEPAADGAEGGVMRSAEEGTSENRRKKVGNWVTLHIICVVILFVESRYFFYYHSYTILLIKKNLCRYFLDFSVHEMRVIYFVKHRSF